MPNGAEFKGKARKEPSFYKPAPAAPQPKEKHWPLLIGGALAGAAILLLIRSRGSTSTGPVLSVYPSGMADTSQIMNMQGTVNAMLSNSNTGQTQTVLPTPDSQGNVTPGGNSGNGSSLPSGQPISGINTGTGVYYPGQVASGQNPNPAPGLAGYSSAGSAGGIPTQGPWVPSSGISEQAWYANQATPIAGNAANGGINNRVYYDVSTGLLGSWTPPAQDTGPAVFNPATDPAYLKNLANAGYKWDAASGKPVPIGS